MLEYARNALGIIDADSAEHGSGSRNIVISPVACSVPWRPPGAPKLFGPFDVFITPETRAATVCGAKTVREESLRNFEVNRDYRARFESAGLRVAAQGADAEVRAVELTGHRFFCARLFQPQLSSTSHKPHAVVLAFLRAASVFKATGRPLSPD